MGYYKSTTSICCSQKGRGRYNAPFGRLSLEYIPIAPKWTTKTKTTRRLGRAQSTLCMRSKTIVGNSVVGQEKVCIAKQKDEDDVEESHRKKEGFHAD